MFLIPKKKPSISLERLNYLASQMIGTTIDFDDSDSTVDAIFSFLEGLSTDMLTEQLSGKVIFRSDAEGELLTFPTMLLDYCDTLMPDHWQQVEAVLFRMLLLVANLEKTVLENALSGHQSRYGLLIDIHGVCPLIALYRICQHEVGLARPQFHYKDGFSAYTDFMELPNPGLVDDACVYLQMNPPNYSGVRAAIFSINHKILGGGARGKMPTNIGGNFFERLLLLSGSDSEAVRLLASVVQLIVDGFNTLDEGEHEHCLNTLFSKPILSAVNASSPLIDTVQKMLMGFYLELLSFSPWYHLVRQYILVDLFITDCSSVADESTADYLGLLMRQVFNCTHLMEGYFTFELAFFNQAKNNFNISLADNSAENLSDQLRKLLSELRTVSELYGLCFLSWCIDYARETKNTALMSALTTNQVVHELLSVVSQGLSDGSLSYLVVAKLSSLRDFHKESELCLRFQELFHSGARSNSLSTCSSSLYSKPLSTSRPSLLPFNVLHYADMRGEQSDAPDHFGLDTCFN